MATCGQSQCYIKNDGINPFRGTVTIKSLELNTGAEQVLRSLSVDMPAGAGITQWFQLNATTNVNETVLTAEVIDLSGTRKSFNVILQAVPVNLVLPRATVQFFVAHTVNKDGTVDINVSTDKVALYVTLTTLAQGRFSDNAFLLTSTQTIRFIPFGPLDMGLLRSSLRLEHLAAYM